MSFSFSNGLLAFLTTLIKEGVFGKSAFAEVIRRNRIATVIVLINLVLCGLLVFTTNEGILRTRQLDAQVKLTEQLQQKFDWLVPPGTPPDQAPQIIIKELVKIEYNYQQCKQERDAYRDVLQERATQETSDSLSKLLQRLRTEK